MTRAIILSLGAAGFLLAACGAYEPLELTNQPGEMLDGPGLFSGEQGEFVILAPSRDAGEDAKIGSDGVVKGKLPSADPPAGYKPVD